MIITQRNTTVQELQLACLYHKQQIDTQHMLSGIHVRVSVRFTIGSMLMGRVEQANQEKRSLLVYNFHRAGAVTSAPYFLLLERRFSVAGFKAGFSAF